MPQELVDLNKKIKIKTMKESQRRHLLRGNLTSQYGNLTHI